MTCAWIEPHGTVVWCDDQTCKHNRIGMCVMDAVDIVNDKCKTKKEVSDDNRLSDHQGKAR